MKNSRAQMMDKYDVELETYGTAAILPGTQLYIDPFGLSPLLGNPSDTPERINKKMLGGNYTAKKALENMSDEIFAQASLAGILGIGGYYIVIESTSFIEAGKYMTKIKAMFDHFGGSAGITTPLDPAEEKDMVMQIQCDASMVPNEPQGGVIHEIRESGDGDNSFLPDLDWP